MYNLNDNPRQTDIANNSITTFGTVACMSTLIRPSVDVFFDVSVIEVFGIYLDYFSYVSSGKHKIILKIILSVQHLESHYALGLTPKATRYISSNIVSDRQLP